MKTLADRVKERRIALGLSQEDLAGAAGVSQGAIYKIETGKTQKPRFLLELARALRVTPEALVQQSAGDEEPSADADDEADRAAYLKAFGRRVAAARARRGLSADDAALGVCSMSRFEAIERGERWPGPLELDRLAGRLDEDLDHLVRGVRPDRADGTALKREREEPAARGLPEGKP